MKIEDFEIGKSFFGSAGFLWLCTDKGSRTITAIRMDPSKDDVWFDGPPYSVNEIVFDEIDMKNCYISEVDMLNTRLHDTINSLHPGYLSKHALTMSKEKMKDNTDFHFIKKSMPLNNAILKRDRVGPKYQIFHPYSMIKDNISWHIKVFDVFNHTFEVIHEDLFITFPIAQNLDFEKAIFIKRNK